MDDKVKRVFNMSDEVMLIRASVMLKNLKADHPAFLLHFPWMDDAYLTVIENDIETADDFDDDKMVTAGKKVTGNKTPMMKEAKLSLKILFKYAYTAYPKNKKKEFLFGQRGMHVARNNVLKMIALLKHANLVANKNPYKNDLLARGYTQPEIDNLQTIAANLNSQNIKHVQEQKLRPVSTDDRISLMNAAFQHLRTIRLCSQVVFMKNPAKIKQYKIYP